MIQITIDNNAVEMAHNLFTDTPKQVNAAANAAISRTLTTLRKEASKTIRRQYSITAKNIKSAFSLKRPTGVSAGGSLVATGSPLHLSKFRIKETRRGPVKVQVKKGGMHPVKGLFIHSKKGPLQRTTQKSYPLRIPYGPSVPQMFGNDAIIGVLVPIAEETLNRRFLHEIEYRYGKG